jgi:PadR family transcriptional regulator PadR
MFQLGSSLLDGCVLAVLAREDAYGYSLTQDIKKVIPVSESTLYPVLRRLQKDQMLTTYDQPHSGRNRRYYRITDGGLKQLRDIQTAWGTFKSGVDSLLELNPEQLTQLETALQLVEDETSQQMQGIQEKQEANSTVHKDTQKGEEAR